jgi:hypothetical protein
MLIHCEVQYYYDCLQHLKMLIKQGNGCNIRLIYACSCQILANTVVVRLSTTNHSREEPYNSEVIKPTGQGGNGIV